MGPTNQTRIIGKCIKQILIEIIKEADKTASFFVRIKTSSKYTKQKTTIARISSLRKYVKFILNSGIILLGGIIMKINTKNLVSITEANQNFSKVARLVDEQGSAVILKNNKPKYVLIEYSAFESEQNSDDECITEISKRILKQNKKAYKELSK